MSTGTRLGLIWIVIALLGLVGANLTGCDGDGDGDGDGDVDGDVDGDSDGDSDSDSDGDATECLDDTDCDNAIFCDGAEQCDPAAEEADENGCVAGDDPCVEDETCDETLGECLPECEFALDADGDGHINVDCGGDDCDDLDVNRYPGNVEVCDGDGHDEDCNPETFGFLDADGDGSASSACCNGIICGEDCNDADSTVHPRAGDGPPLSCDGVDNDCDGIPDNACPCTEGETAECGTPAQISRIGLCEPGAVICSGGGFTDECIGGVAPQEEVCDGLDNDCDGTDDDGVLRTYYEDADGDGYGVGGTTMRDCSPTDGWASNPDDCDDMAAGVNPAASEVCNGLDDNCDGLTDEGLLRTFYADDDGDGYGDLADTTTACHAPAGYVASSTDCDDTAAAVNPAAVDDCDGVDNDCDGDPDPGCVCTDGATRPCGDSDVGECELGEQRCIDGLWAGCVGAVIPRAESCNGVDDDCDGSTDEETGPTWFLDADGDGFGIAGTTTVACSRPAGYAALPTDCNDSEAGINPASVEVCDGIDNNCDSATDPGCICTDGSTQPCGTTDVGECSFGTQLCIGGGWAECVGSVGPHTESCNSADDDCDGAVDEDAGPTWYLDEDGDGFGLVGSTTVACTRPADHASIPGDCDDDAAAINPSATELCDLVDNNCDGATDTDCTCTTGVTRSCGATAVGACEYGTQRCIDGLWADCVGAVTAVAESCNGVDDDCDGSTDESVGPTWYRDVDGDGFGIAGTTTQACTRPAGYAGMPGDCNDGVAAINPAAFDFCDGLDNNCDGSTDPGCSCTDGTTQPCGTSSVGECEMGTELCLGGSWGTCIGDVDAITEVCNGLDDDCDGTEDDGFPCVAGDSMACISACGTGGTQYCAPDCSGWLACRAPAEVCNGCDDDLDGAVDESFSCVQDTVEPCVVTACGTPGNLYCDSSCDYVTTECAAVTELCNYCDDDRDGTFDDDRPLATDTNYIEFNGCNMDPYGSASTPAPLCVGAHESSLVAGGFNTAGALWYEDPVRIGWGAFDVHAWTRVRLRTAGSAPADGWAVVIANGGTGNVGDFGGSLGVPMTRTGLAIEWRFYSTVPGADQGDTVEVRRLTGSGSGTVLRYRTGIGRSEQNLGLEDGTTSEWQHLYITYTPEDPTTPAADELLEIRNYPSDAPFITLRSVRASPILLNRVLNRELDPGSELDLAVTGATGGLSSYIYLQQGRNFETDPLSSHVSADEVCF